MELQCHASQQISLKAYQKQMTVQNKSKSRKAVLQLHISVLVPVFLPRVSKINEIVSGGGNDTVGIICLVLRDDR
jgi:hypothetical protein